MNRRAFIKNTAGLLAASQVMCTKTQGATLNTAAGPVAADDLGIVLMHEHIMVDFTPAENFIPDNADHDTVVAAVLPRLQEAHALGVRTLVDASSYYLGRRADIYRTLSQRSGVRIVCATGLYRDPYYPEFVRTEPIDKIVSFLRSECTIGLDGTDVMPGVIKLAASKDALTPEEEKVHRAAAVIQKEFGLTITIHCPDGRVGLAILDILKAEGADCSRVVLYHSSGTNDTDIHARIAETGAFPLFDGIGKNADKDDVVAGFLESLFSRGLGNQVLIGGDVTWFDVADKTGQKSAPAGGRIHERGYGYIIQTLLPKLRSRGFAEDQIQALMVENPRRALTGL
jgi:phosphotriesterase-related protein